MLCPFRLNLPERRVNKMNNIPVIDVIATGRNINDLRVRAGLTVRDLQRILGFSNPQAIYKWQNGLSIPSIDNLVILAAVLNASIDDIIVLQEAIS